MSTNVDKFNKELNNSPFIQNMNALFGSQQNAATKRGFTSEQYQKNADQLINSQAAYQTPGQYGQVQSLYSNLYNNPTALSSGAGQYTSDLTNALQGMSASGQQLGSDLGTSLGSYGDASAALTQGATSLRSLMQSGAGEAKNQSALAQSTGLADTNKFVDYYRTLAAGNEMPGQGLMENKLNRSAGEAYGNISRASGGSASGLGAMIDVFRNKSNSLTDLGVQAAQFKSQNQQNLATGLQGAAQMKYNINQQAATDTLSRTGMLGQAEQAAAGMQSSGLTNLAAAQGQAASTKYNAGMDYSNASIQNANLQQQYNQNLDASTMQRAQLNAQGMLTNASAYENAQAINREQWGNRMSYATDMAQKYDPFESQMKLFGEMAGIQYANQQAFYNKKAQDNASLYTFFNPMGNYGG